MKRVAKAIDVLLLVWGAFTFLYLALVFMPSSFIIHVDSFHVDDVPVGGYASIQSQRCARIDLGGDVIEEINIISSGGVEVAYRAEREVLAEKGCKNVKRQINYQHNQTGTYEIDIRVTYDIWFGINKVIILQDTYKVF